MHGAARMRAEVELELFEIGAAREPVASLGRKDGTGASFGSAQLDVVIGRRTTVEIEG